MHKVLVNVEAFMGNGVKKFFTTPANIDHDS